MVDVVVAAGSSVSRVRTEAPGTTSCPTYADHGLIASIDDESLQQQRQPPKRQSSDSESCGSGLVNKKPLELQQAVRAELERAVTASRAGPSIRKQPVRTPVDVGDCVLFIRGVRRGSREDILPLEAAWQPRASEWKRRAEELMRGSVV
ncbi:hypothetical protein CGC21_9570 [Leishmania donovani]|uniref:Uncharacterized protein n=1 Tax=Leishmania donovani TaxID=5661 RepID=A0A504XGS1_LEIDO|nr:hypothetical protein CGC21_9570 [Leishmania donovani]